MENQPLPAFSNIPPPNAKRIAVRVTRTAEQIIRSGHPWLFDGSIHEVSFDGRPGDLAVVFDRKRKFLAIGLYDPLSPIRVRILHQGSPEQIDAGWWRTQITAAVARRAPLAAPEKQTDGYRLIYGEGDGLPGLVVDKYAGTLVIKLYSAAWVPYLPLLLPLLLEAQPAERVVLRFSRHLQAEAEYLYGLSDGQTVYGEPPTEPIVFQENGLTFAADVVHGHKTGFFFDHRPNRELVGKLARGKTVLDVFAYVGAFSLYAAAGGAAAVTSLDVSAPALAAARHNFVLNADRPEVQAAAHHILAADAFAALEQMATNEESFDLVVVDPPSFAKSQAEIGRALAAYERLTQLALGVLRPEGMLVIASCSSQVSERQFFQTVFEAAEEAGRPLWEQRRTGHGVDHPLRPEFPEGAYLKCLFATTID